MKMVKLLLLMLLAVATVNGHHILVIQGGLSRSHYNLVAEITNILLKAGHEVTFMSAYQEPKPPKNLHYIDISSALKVIEHVDVTQLEIWTIDFVVVSGRNISNAVVKLPAVQQALLSSDFDAVVSEWFFSDMEAGYAAVLQVPWIILCGTVLHPHMQQMVDIARDLPTMPVQITPHLPPMDFASRVRNTIAHLQTTWKQYFTSKSNYEKNFAPIAQARGVPLPPFADAARNVSILLVNSHPSFAPTHSLPPNVVEVGGYHIADETPPLPKDLQDILDASPQGAIYFSMGSNVKAMNLQEKMKQGLIDLFKSVPQTILWKSETDLPGVSKNVHIRPWMPQTSILAHPNVKLFITHSGMLSTIEAVKFGVPLITVPVFVDQPINSHSSVRAGHAIEVKFTPDMAEDLGKALREILTNDSYSRRAKEMSKLFNNRIVPAKKLILHYIEMAIDSRGAAHLRLSHQLAWYELWMLDQIAFLLLVLYIAFKIVRKLINFNLSMNTTIKEKIH